MTMKNGWVVAMLVMVGCGGPSFVNGTDDSMVPDANLGADSEVDTQTGVQNDSGNRVDVHTDAGADMVGQGDAPGTTEASADAGSDGETDGDAVPTCPDDEVYPQASPTCAKWIATTPWPLEKPCCRQDTHTCGHRVTFSPFCVELH
jgi:hypothetical protein